ncbi:MAG: hypothetical protein QM477_09135, partial [Planctomycetota bacterium]
PWGCPRWSLTTIAPYGARTFLVWRKTTRGRLGNTRAYCKRSLELWRLGKDLISSFAGNSQLP